MRRPPSYIPTVGMRVRRVEGTRTGQYYTISDVFGVAGQVGIFNLTGEYDDGAQLNCDAERFEYVGESLTPDVSQISLEGQPFAIGQEVIISERVRAGLNGPDSAHCRVAETFIGQLCVVDAVRPDGSIRFHWNGGSNSWQLQPEYLDAKDAPVPIATAAWRFAVSGRDCPSIMESLWPKIATNINSLSRVKTDWYDQLLNRAVLRLRRLHENCYEEQLVKGQGYAETGLARLAWRAATRANN